MKINTKFFLVVLCCATCFFTFLVSAQNITPCGTTEVHLKLMDTDPVYKKNYLAEQSRLAALDKAAFANGYKDAAKPASPNSPPKYIIPVVFHIIHQFGTENISDAQVRDAIRTLNEDFRKRNKDTINTIPAFKSIAADCEIEFRLAQLDPKGNPTNGIERIASVLTNNGYDSAKLNPWPRRMYLNIWVVKYVRQGFAAFANYPGGPEATDGILCLDSYIGAIGTSSLLTSHTLSHEAAHWFNVQHVWGNTNAPEVGCGDDEVSDTPETKGHNNKCPLDEKICKTGIVENVQNFMEYSYCYTMFTNGQKTRMHNALNGTAGDRNNLWTTANLIATGILGVPALTKADFTTNRLENATCEGSTVTFMDNSWNGRPTAWNWVFEGGVPATSTDSMPVVKYAAPGTYDVTLTVSNSTATLTSTKKDYVTIHPAAGLGNFYYGESFETDTIPNADWKVSSKGDGNTWKRTAEASIDRTYSVMIQNPTNTDTYRDDLIGPAIDMTKIAGPDLVLAFSVAYAKRTSASNDKLEIYFSSNCGETWDFRGLVSAAKMSNGLIETGNYIPAPSHWKQQAISLSSYSLCKNLLYKFTFVSNNGNNIYLDKINITGAIGIKEGFMNRLNLNVYPNPMNENSVVSFELEEKEEVAITIQDVVGRKVSTVFAGNLSAGHHEYPISGSSKLSAGIYFVNFTGGEHMVSQKLIIN